MGVGLLCVILLCEMVMMFGLISFSVVRLVFIIGCLEFDMIVCGMLVWVSMVSVLLVLWWWCNLVRWVMKWLFLCLMKIGSVIVMLYWFISCLWIVLMVMLV